MKSFEPWCCCLSTKVPRGCSRTKFNGDWKSRGNWLSHADQQDGHWNGVCMCACSEAGHVRLTLWPVQWPLASSELYTVILTSVAPRNVKSRLFGIKFAGIVYSVYVIMQKVGKLLSLHNYTTWSTWMMKATVSSPCASATKIEPTNRRWRQWPFNGWSATTEWTFISLFDFTFLALIVLPKTTRYQYVLWASTSSLLSVTLVNYLDHINQTAIYGHDGINSYKRHLLATRTQ